MAEVVIHHISHGGTVLTLAVHYPPQQFAGALLLIAVEHLQGEEVVGRRADVCVSVLKYPPLIVTYYLTVT